MFRSVPGGTSTRFFFSSSRFLLYFWQPTKKDNASYCFLNISRSNNVEIFLLGISLMDFLFLVLFSSYSVLEGICLLQTFAIFFFFRGGYHGWFFFYLSGFDSFDQFYEKRMDGNWWKINCDAGLKNYFTVVLIHCEKKPSASSKNFVKYIRQSSQTIFLLMKPDIKIKIFTDFSNENSTENSNLCKIFKQTWKIPNI